MRVTLVKKVQEYIKSIEKINKEFFTDGSAQILLNLNSI